MLKTPLAWAQLKPHSPFESIFPTGRVPLRSPFPFLPDAPSAPPCYLLDAECLTFTQITALAKMLLRQFYPDCPSLDSARDYVRASLPIKCDWFVSVTFTDHSLLLPFVVLGQQMDEEEETLGMPESIVSEAAEEVRRRRGA